MKNTFKFNIGDIVYGIAYAAPFIGEIKERELRDRVFGDERVTTILYGVDEIYPNDERCHSTNEGELSFNKQEILTQYKKSLDEKFNTFKTGIDEASKTITIINP